MFSHDLYRGKSQLFGEIKDNLRNVLRGVCKFNSSINGLSRHSYQVLTCLLLGYVQQKFFRYLSV